MAKHHRVWNEAIYRKYLREGRGQGVGANYTPWILVQDFPSRGMVSRIQGTKAKRMYHMMSNLETKLFYIMDWSDDIYDIREQYPLLDLRQIIEIAEAAQIRYPYNIKSGFPYVMTSDFYLETTSGPTVIAVKTTADLKNHRTREKLEIERRYWNNRNIRWKIVTEHEINQTKAKNIEWLSQAKDLGAFSLPEKMQEKCIEYFLIHYHAKKNSMDKLITDLKQRFGLSAGMGINIYKHLAYWKRIDFDAAEPVDFSIFTSWFTSQGIAYE